MLMKAKSTGLTISRTLVQVADYHYNEAMQWWDMYSHCFTEGATHLVNGEELSVKDGLVHPDFVKASRMYLARYNYHTAVADYIMTHGKPVAAGFGNANAEVRDRAGLVGEFEKAVEQRGEIAKQAHMSRLRKKHVQRTPTTETDREDTIQTVH